MQASPEGVALVESRGLSKHYIQAGKRFAALDGVSVSIAAGEFVAVVGKSGSGKSTLLNLVAGLDRPSAGEIRVGSASLQSLDETRLAEWRGRNVGVVFQFFQLLPTLTVVENVMLPLDFCHYLPPKPARRRALELLDLVGIADQAGKLPSELSGGQQQRAAIARALANNPALLVADEPTGNLDSHTADAVLALLNRLTSEGKTMRDRLARPIRVIRRAIHAAAAMG